MGRHRKTSGRRGVSAGFLLTVAVILAVIAALIAWLWLRETSSSQSSAASGDCVLGERTLTVLTDPSLADPLAEVGEKFTDEGPVVRDECITVVVDQATDAEALALLAGGADDEDADVDAGGAGLPDLWVPTSQVAVDRLRAADATVIRPEGRSLATSPLVLAVPAGSADDFGEPAWSELPGRQGEDATALALPAEASSTVLTELAVLAGRDGRDGRDGELDSAQVRSPESVGALREMRGGPADRFPDTDAALAALLGGDDDALATPVTAQGLHAALGAEAGASDRVVAVAPDGPAPLADFPAVMTFAAADDDTASRAGSVFAEYVRAPEQAAMLAAHGFLPGLDTDTGAPADDDQAAAALPADGPVPLTAPAQLLARPSAEVVDAVAPAVRSAGTGTTTILLDVSGSMGWLDGGRPRIDVVTELLDARLGELGDGVNVGLWSYSAYLAGESPYRMDVSTGPLEDVLEFGGTRREGIIRTLDRAVPVSSTYTYRSVEAVYAAAVEGYVPDQRNSVLLITDGPNDDPAHLSTQRLLDTLAATSDPERPVAIDVLVISPNPDIDSLRRIAEVTGGEIVEVPDSTDPATADALEQMLR